jgi:hypothetical protein
MGAPGGMGDIEATSVGEGSQLIAYRGHRGAIGNIGDII